MPEIWQSLASAGVPALLMAVAVRWLVTSNTSLIGEIREQWDQRLNDLSAQNQECQEDRKVLRNIIITHSDRLHTLEKSNPS